MNLLFWLVITLLIFIALVVVILPLWRKNELPEADIDQRNIEISRQRLAELKQQLQDGVLNQGQYDEQYQELALALNDDLESHVATAPVVSQGRWMIGLLVLFVPLFSLFLYFQLGETEALKKEQQQRQLRQQQQSARAQIVNMVSSLAKKLERNPNDSEGWVMLGRSYKYMKQYAQAAQAFSQAYQLRDNDVGVMLQYADALAMMKGGQLQGKPTVLIFQALQMSPENNTALWLAGMAKAETGEYSEALQYWQKLESLLPKDSKSHQELLGLIKTLKSRLGETASKQNITAKSIEVKVNIDPALLEQVKARDTVFIYAQALNGPRMPLAIIRKQAGELPLSVELNDSMAMTPAMKLSSFGQVKVIARISKTGNAMQQTGDLMGTAEISALQKQNMVTITINQQVK